MLAAMPLPTYPPAAFSSPYKPIVPSPLSSSSPIRASSPPALPLFSRDPNRRDHHHSTQTQSSPLQAPAPKFEFTSPPTPHQSDGAANADRNKFKYASRPAKPNPRQQKSRAHAQEGRRRLFLNNVRQRRDDREWERRGGDQEVLKLEWSLLDRQRRAQKDADADGIVGVPEDDDQVAYGYSESGYRDGFPTTLQPPLHPQQHYGPPRLQQQQPVQSHPDGSMQVDEIPEEAEMDAMFSTYYEKEKAAQRQQQQQQSSLPDRPGGQHSLSDDDDDYDSLFMDLLSLQQQAAPEAHGDPDTAMSHEMDMS